MRLLRPKNAKTLPRLRASPEPSKSISFQNRLARSCAPATARTAPQRPESGHGSSVLKAEPSMRTPPRAPRTRANLNAKLDGSISRWENYLHPDSAQRGAAIPEVHAPLSAAAPRDERDVVHAAGLQQAHQHLDELPGAHF